MSALIYDMLTFGLFGIAALGKQGGENAIGMLKTLLKQVMDQVCCPTQNCLKDVLL